MKRNLSVRTLMATFVALPLIAMADEPDCFPMCAESAKVEIAIDTKVDAKLDTIDIMSPRESSADPCEAGFMKQADDLNNRTKPLREIIGYVRSPQGLAVKLVNDHIVKIPAWMGYAMDPIGSIKHRALDEVKTQVKDAMSDSKACAQPADPIPYPSIDIYVGHSA